MLLPQLHPKRPKTARQGVHTRGTRAYGNMAGCKLEKARHPLAGIHGHKAAVGRTPKPLARHGQQLRPADVPCAAAHSRSGTHVPKASAPGPRIHRMQAQSPGCTHTGKMRRMHACMHAWWGPPVWRSSLLEVTSGRCLALVTNAGLQLDRAVTHSIACNGETPAIQEELSARRSRALCVKAGQGWSARPALGLDAPAPTAPDPSASDAYTTIQT